MKKFICAILTSAFLLTSVTPAFAAGSINVSETIFSQIMTEFSENMPTDPNQRIAIWKTFKAYMIDGSNGIETIIGALEGTKPVPDDLKPIFDRFVNSVSGEYGDQFVFFLKLYSTTSATARKTALDNFGSDPVLQPDGRYTEIIKTPLPVSEEAKAAAEAIFSTYVSDDAEAGFATHGIDVANFLNLITPFKGLFKMTDASNGDFVLSDEYKASFAKDLAQVMDDYTSVNGVKIDSEWTDAVKGYKILTGIVDMFNSFDDEQMDNLKVVLSDPEIDLYEEGLSEAEDITPSEDDEEEDDDQGTTTRPGGGGIVRPGGSSSSSDVFELTVPTYSTSSKLYSDMSADNWATPYVMNLSDRNIFKGYEDGTFRPDISISRQEIAVALVRAMGLEADAEMASNNATGFADDAEIADWARGYVNMAVSKNLFTGYDDGEFKPTRTISRQELVTVVMRLSGDTETSTAMSYSDVGDIQDYAREYVGRATNLKIVGGYPDNTFQPFNDVTRAEAAKILYGGLEYYKFVK